MYTTDLENGDLLLSDVGQLSWDVFEKDLLDGNRHPRLIHVKVR